MKQYFAKSVWVGLCLLLSPLSPFAQRCLKCRTELDTLNKKKDFPAIEQYITRQFKECPDSFYCLGLAYTKLSFARYNAGEIQAAITFGEKALAFRKKVPYPIAYEIANTCNNLGWFYKSIYNYDKAAGYFNEAITHGGKLRDPIVSFIYQNLANVMIDLGDFNSALEYYHLAIKISYELKDTARIVNTLMGFGNALHELERYRESIDTLKKAVVFLQKIATEKNPYAASFLGCHNNLARSYKELGLHEESLRHYQRGLSFLQPDALQDKALLLNNLSTTHRRLKNLPNAFTCLQQSMSISQKQKLQGILAMNYDNLGDLKLEEGNFTNALSNYHRAIIETLPEFKNQDFRSNPTLPLIAQSDCIKDDLLVYLSDKARGWLNYYHQSGKKDYLQYALETFKLADGVIQLMRREHTMKGSKLFWRQKTKPLYEDALEASFLLGDAGQAFYFLERSKAVLLLDALAAVQSRNLLPADLKMNERQLIQQLADARKKLAAALGKPDESTARKTMLEQQEKLSKFYKALQTNHPNYYNLKIEPKMLSLQEVKDKMLDDTTAFIHYFVGENSLFAMSIFKDGPSRLHKIPIREINTSLYEVLRILSSKRGIAFDENPEQFALLSNRLYQQLLAPLIEPKVSSLVIVPDMQVAFLPFEALLTKPGFHVRDFLIFQYSVQYAYSASVLFTQKMLGKPSQSLVTFAPVFTNGRNNLPELTDSRETLNQLDFQNSQCYPGERATKRNFLEKGLFSDLIFLYTHAAGDNPRIEFYDSTLYLSELEAYSLAADLVILGACETGYGNQLKGEGVESMSSGFATAGAASLIFSLWSVNAKSTAHIFSLFFDKLSDGKTKAQALRAAKLNHLQSASMPDQNPYVWAAFVFYGNDGQAALHPQNNLSIVLLILAVAGTTVLLFMKKGKKAQAKMQEAA
jgi:CHAT domain-containing protein/tetratricopeptide (TPR) repeat protein